MMMLVSGTGAGATEGKGAGVLKGSHGKKVYDRQDQMRKESQALLKEINEQRLEIQCQSKSVEQLNRQLQQQLIKVQKDKSTLTSEDIKTLRSYLQSVRDSSQRLRAGDQSFNTAQKQWKQNRGKQTDQALARQSLEAVKSAQAEKIKELAALQDELKKLNGLLAAKVRR